MATDPFEQQLQAFWLSPLEDYDAWKVHMWRWIEGYTQEQREMYFQVRGSLQEQADKRRILADNLEETGHDACEFHRRVAEICEHVLSITDPEDIGLICY